MNVWLRMLGHGYFHLQIDGQPTLSGRSGYITPEEVLATVQRNDALQPLAPAALPAILGCIGLQPTRSPATLYLGEAGSGKSWQLAHHRAARGISRRIQVDLAQPHRQVVIHLIESAGAMAPPARLSPNSSRLPPSPSRPNQPCSCSTTSTRPAPV